MSDEQYDQGNKITSVWAWSCEVADGVLEHYVAFCNDDGDPIGDPITCYNPATAQSIGERKASVAGVEFIADLLWEDSDQEEEASYYGFHR